MRGFESADRVARVAARAGDGERRTEQSGGRGARSSRLKGLMLVAFYQSHVMGICQVSPPPVKVIANKAS
jgi:hypothetical protein